jgi:KUP system potassium uptake protein
MRTAPYGGVPSLTPPAEASEPPRHKLAPLAVGALGVVFGDIATSPLYAFRQCFTGPNAPSPSPENVVAIASLFVWTLAGVVCVKYATFIMKANNHGEGGTLALLGLIYPTDPLKAAKQRALPLIALVVLFGTAALYGDGVITPAISVLSAVEGIGVATPAAQHLAVPITVVILIALFGLQARGTGRIGALFGPIMLLWCVAIAIFGGAAVVQHPAILAALNPWYGLRFVAHANAMVLVVLGATVLCVSGAEALYADLGHFGINPIRLAWYGAVFPALVLAYLGQGALALGSPKLLEFYALVPAWALVPMVILATAATIIASQALISGAFSLSEQAAHLGYVPRLAVVHTSREQEGQIYMPFVNTAIGVLCVILVLAFRRSDKLADAYGLAVTLTMLTSTVAYAALTRRSWRWPWWQTLAVTVFFLCFDGSFLAGNVLKIPTGGWIPLAVAVVVFTLFVTWHRGRRRQARVLERMSLSVDEFLKVMDAGHPAKLPGTAIFLTAHPEGIPYALLHQFERTRAVYEVMVLLTIVFERRPWVPKEERVVIETLREKSFYRITAHYGFMEVPKIPEILRRCKQKGSEFDFRDATFFLNQATILPADGPRRMPGWQRRLFAWMLTNARPIETVLDIPPEHTIRVGVAVPV